MMESQSSDRIEGSGDRIEAQGKIDGCGAKFRVEKGKWYIELEPGSACEMMLGRMVELPREVVSYLSKHITTEDPKLKQMLDSLVSQYPKANSQI